MIRLAALSCFLLAAANPSLAMAAPEQLRFEVADYLDASGRKWIRMSAEFECLYGEGLEKVVSTLWDFKDAPMVFSRVERVRVRWEDEHRAVTEQRTGVAILGLGFLSDLVFENSLTRGPGEAIVSFASIESDGSCLYSKGAWALQERDGPAGKETYARFSLESVVASRFPGQASIMRAFGPEDMARTMLELAQAMARS